MNHLWICNYKNYVNPGLNESAWFAPPSPPPDTEAALPLCGPLGRESDWVASML